MFIEFKLWKTNEVSSVLSRLSIASILQFAIAENLPILLSSFVGKTLWQGNHHVATRRGGKRKGWSIPFTCTLYLMLLPAR